MFEVILTLAIVAGLTAVGTLISALLPKKWHKAWYKAMTGEDYDD